MLSNWAAQGTINSQQQETKTVLDRETLICRLDYEASIFIRKFLLPQANNHTPKMGH